MTHHKTSNTLADLVRAIPGGEHLEMCYSCGTCVSKCMIQQKVEPTYNPRRLLHLVISANGSSTDIEQEIFESPTTWLCSACDLCYPACPQEIHISSVIGAIKQLAVEAGYESPLETVSVDETLCSGCGICVMACPYEAPDLVDKEYKDADGSSDMDRADSKHPLAEVDANKCMGCGICVAACPMGAIARPGVSNQEIVAQIPTTKTDDEPNLLVFVCDWCLRSAEDVSLLEDYPDNVQVIHIPCSGRIDPQMALLALRAGIDGVLVCGCEPGECHYQRGNYVSTCKIGVLRRMFDQMKVGNGKPASGRVSFVQIGTQDRGRIRKEMDHMLEHLAALEEVNNDEQR